MGNRKAGRGGQGERGEGCRGGQVQRETDGGERQREGGTEGEGKRESALTPFFEVFKYLPAFLERPRTAALQSTTLLHCLERNVQRAQILLRMDPKS